MGLELLLVSLRGEGAFIPLSQVKPSWPHSVSSVLLFSGHRTEEAHVHISRQGGGIGLGSRICRHLFPLAPVRPWPTLPRPALQSPCLPCTPTSLTAAQWYNLPPRAPVVILPGSEAQHQCYTHTADGKMFYSTFTTPVLKTKAQRIGPSKSNVNIIPLVPGVATVIF